MSKADLTKTVYPPKNSPEPPRLSKTRLSEVDDSAQTKRTLDPPIHDHDVEKSITEGKKESIKDLAKEEEESKQKIEELAAKKHQVLFQTKSVFPFDFFPDTVSLEPTRVNFSIRSFISTAEIRSIQIEDIYDVKVDTSLFFSTLTVTSKISLSEKTIVRFLRTRDALYIRRLIAGLRTLTQEGVKVELIESIDLVNKIEELGKIEAET